METKELIDLRQQHNARARSLMDWYADRPMPADVAAKIEQHLKSAEAITAQLGGKTATYTSVDKAPVYKHAMGAAGAVQGASFGGGRGIDTRADLSTDRLSKGQRVTDWAAANGIAEPATEDLSLGRYLKGIVTGDWRNAEAEQEMFVKSGAEGSIGAGGAIVPTPLSLNLIDLVRNQSRVFDAGATTVPMTSSTLKIPRLTGEGTPGWRAENASITANADLAFDQVSFTAHSLNRIVTISVELMEDSDPSAGQVIQNSFARQIALELDRAALLGSGTSNQPTGVLNQSGVTQTTHGANGTSLNSVTVGYDWFLDAAGSLRSNNFEPNGHIVAPRTVTTLRKIRQGTTSAYLAPPEGLPPIYQTNQIPTNVTVGTSNNASYIFTAAWENLLIGMRTQFRLQVLTERYADTGQYGFVAWFRGDVQVAHPLAFVVDNGVLP